MCFHLKTNKIYSFGFTPSSGNQEEILPPPSTQKEQCMSYGYKLVLDVCGRVWACL